MSVLATVGLAAVLFAASSQPVSSAPHPSLATVKADARAEGNRLAQARALARVLLERPLPAQLLKVRVDGVGAHEVAGLVLSGVKFHGNLDRAGFEREVAALVARAFAVSSVEEVDVTTIVPIAFLPGTIVSGDLAKPTARTVYTATIRRAGRSQRASATYADPAWERHFPKPR